MYVETVKLIFNEGLADSRAHGSLIADPTESTMSEKETMATAIRLTRYTLDDIEAREGLIPVRTQPGTIPNHVLNGLLNAARASVEYNRQRSGRPESLTGVEALLVALGG